MPKLAANLSMLYTNFYFLDRFEAAAKAGFKGVEYLFPYNREASEIAELLEKNQLTQVLFNLPAGDWRAGDRGTACDPNRINEFREGVDLAIEYAKALDCKQCNALAGLLPEGVSPEQAHETLVANLKYAADRMQTAGVRLLAEAINTKDMPGFFLNTSKQGFDLIKEVNSPNFAFQYDCYHMQIMEGNLAGTIKENLKNIKHIQIADTPGRHEPGTGEIDYKFLLNYLDEIGYEGWVGCEYIPVEFTDDGLGWIEDCNIRL
ncbi:MAG: hydroxypyruvate isomerase [Pseudomonadales bacterium]